MPPCNGFALSLPVLCPASTNKCLQLLAIESTLWTFVDLVGIEPTNNGAQGALRPAVIWQRTNFGTQSQTDSEFIARLLKVISSLQT